MVVGNLIPSKDLATRILVLTIYFPSGSAFRFVTSSGLLIIVQCRRRFGLGCCKGNVDDDDDDDDALSIFSEEDGDNDEEDNANSSSFSSSNK